MKKWISFLLMTVFAASQSSAASAPSADPFSLFSEEASVMTASRRPQSIQEAPVAVDVITADEIRASGAMNLWDLLRFRTGIDVVDAHSNLDGNRAIVSVRGFPQVFAANLQVLVDGRSAYKALNDGTFWDTLPVQIQDIDRIEIIRGPNAALYGTGAGLGVINILTKKPDGRTRFSTDNRVGNLGLRKTANVIESHIGKAAFRASYTYRRQDGFPLASTENEANDFLNKQMTNVRTEIPLSSRSSLSLLGGASWTNSGLADVFDARNTTEDHFEMLKFSHNVSPASTIEVTTSHSDSLARRAPSESGQTDIRNLQDEAEILHRLDWGQGRLNTTYGLGYRDAVAESAQDFPGDGRASVDFFRGFLSQMVRPLRDVSVQGSAALEHSSVSGQLPSYQLAAVISPAPTQSFRVSYSVARTVQDLFPLFADTRVSPTTRFVGNPDLAPYRVTSYEVGYHGEELDHHLQMDESLFYTLVDNFHRAEFESFNPAPPMTTLEFQNYDDAITRGSESSIKYRFASSRSVYINYTYERISDRAGDGPIRVDNTPNHKVNLGGIAAVGHGFTLSANVGYKNAYTLGFETGGMIDVPAYWRVDARLAYMPPKARNVELYLAGQNLTTPNHVEAPDGLTVPRTYQSGFSMKFGGV